MMMRRACIITQMHNYLFKLPLTMFWYRKRKKDGRLALIHTWDVLWLSPWHDLMGLLTHLSHTLLIRLSIAAYMCEICMMSTCILMRLCHSLGCKLTCDITAMLQMSPRSRECALVGTSAWALRRTPQRGRQRKSSMVLYSVTQMPETRSDGVFSKVASVRVWLQRPFKHAGEALITIIRLMRWKTWI